MSHILSAVTLRHFRSYDEASFEFDAGVNIVIGPNAIGKTNLLEAVHVACFGKGFRASSDAELLQKDQEWARIDAVFGNSTRTVKLEKPTGQLRLKKKFELGGRVVSRLGFEDLIPVVLFEPDLLRLASGGPERRRVYIDTLVSKITPGYRQDILAYDRVLKQRNALLKTGKTHSEQLFVWNIQLSQRGAKIVAGRRAAIALINAQISDVYSLVAGSKHTLELLYSEQIADDQYADSLMNRLDKNLHTDLRRGYTSAGPHRDDITLQMNRQSMKDTASRGENRTLLLALKIIELKLIEEKLREKPLLLLDDVFSELDGSRRKLLTRFLADHQTLITTTDADVVGKKFAQLARITTLEAS